MILSPKISFLSQDDKVVILFLLFITFKTLPYVIPNFTKRTSEHSEDYEPVSEAIAECVSESYDII